MAFLRKAEEYMRLAEIRGSSSIFAGQGKSGSCKAALCLELSAINCGQSVNRVRQSDYFILEYCIPGNISVRIIIAKIAS